jgi:RNA ligase
VGYLHIDNLYKDQRILMFRECFALEKIHGTSAHVSWRDGRVTFSSGGEKHERFAALFDEVALTVAFEAMRHPSVTVYGEAYGGSQQKQTCRYGPALRFVAFEVEIGEAWLSVVNAHDVVKKIGLEFVHYRRVPTDLDAIDAERDAPSEQARRNGVEGDQPREGVVLRPLEDMRDARGNRILAKHKRDEERETTSPRKVVDPSKIEVLRAANEIADEWVTPTRLAHVLDKLGPDVGIENMRDVIAAMTDDVIREAAGEIVDSREARSAIGKKTAETFKARLQASLRESV